MIPVQISEKIYFIGSNDRRTQLFENYWPLENGVSYNSYLIDDQKTALIETLEVSKSRELIEKIKKILGTKTLDYLIINHMEPDHSGSISSLIKEYPKLRLVGNKKTFPLLEGFYGISENTIVVEEGQVLNLGIHKLEFYTMPMVHWPESMVTYDKTDKILFSSDAFGSFGTLDGGIFDDEVNLEYYHNEIRRYYSNIVGKYGNPVQKIVEKLATLELKMIAPSHGLLWRSQISMMFELYKRWSTLEAENGVVIVFGSLYGNTEKMADAIARYLSEEGIKNIRIFDASKTHISYIINEIWRFKGLILGSAAYNGSIFTPMAHVIHYLKHLGLKNRHIGIFGTSGWGGGGVRELKKYAEENNLEVLLEPSEARCSPKENDFEYCRQLAKKMAEKLK